MMIIMSKSLYCSRTAKAGNLTRIDTQLQNHAQYTEQKGSHGPSISMVPKDQSLKVSVYRNNFPDYQWYLDLRTPTIRILEY